MTPAILEDLLRERPIRVDDSDGCVYGTAPYIAPECLLAAGWTVDLLDRMAKRAGRDWDDEGSSVWTDDWTG